LIEERSRLEAAKAALQGSSEPRKVNDEPPALPEVNAPAAPKKKGSAKKRGEGWRKAKASAWAKVNAAKAEGTTPKNKNKGDGYPSSHRTIRGRRVQEQEV
jgi:hypothetical protein